MNGIFKNEQWKVYVIFVIIVEALGAITGWLNRDGFALYSMMEKPSLTPPAIVFPIVWTILYALMGIGAARIFLSEDDGRQMALRLFAVQLLVNLAWTFVFFQYQNYLAAFFVLLILWVLIWWMIFAWREVDPLAAKLQIPYLIWVTFAGYLNYMLL